MSHFKLIYKANSEDAFLFIYDKSKKKINLIVANNNIICDKFVVVVVVVVFISTTMYQSIIIVLFSLLFKLSFVTFTKGQATSFFH